MQGVKARVQRQQCRGRVTDEGQGLDRRCNSPCQSLNANAMQCRQHGHWRGGGGGGGGEGYLLIL